MKQPVQDKRLQDWFHSASPWLKNEGDALATRDGLSLGWQFLVFGLAIIALFFRCPRLLTHAQFYAEDGTIWFAQAYNDGWMASLALPQAGYLNTMPRIAAGLALLAPLLQAPLIMAVVGLLVQGLPVPILLSSRLRNWGSLPMRMLLAAIYIALPNTREIHLVATNTQWHLALTAALSCLPVVRNVAWTLVRYRRPPGRLSHRPVLYRACPGSPALLVGAASAVEPVGFRPG